MKININLLNLNADIQYVEGQEAFLGCANLKKVVIGKGVADVLSVTVTI